MAEVLPMLFLMSGITVMLLRLTLVSHLLRHRELYLSLEEPRLFRFGDTFAIRVFQQFGSFSTGFRVLLVVHLVAWIVSWILPFVILGGEIGQR